MPKVIKIEEIDFEGNTYNLQVEDNHNYVANGVIVSNCHTAKAKSIQDILGKCSNAKFRIGLSGTLPEEKTSSWFAIVGSLGRIRRFVDYKKLKEDKRVANLIIKQVVLKYDYKTRVQNYITYGGDYQKETEFVNNLEVRTQFINKMVNSLENNTMVLFTKISHGKNIKATAEINSDKKFLYIDGGVSADDRNLFREIMENTINEKIIYFGKHKIKVKYNILIPLTNGTEKLAKDITIDDDISNKWIKKKL